VRAVQFLLLVLVVVLLVLPFVMRRRTPARPRPALPDELVKDPVCQTYVLRSRAVTGASSSGPPFFCSAECARRYAGGARG
jgi:YHS domain-containing protein